MKKAAKRKIFRTPKVKPKNSLLLFAILIIAIVGFAVWAVITKGSGKTPFALTPLQPVSSLSVNWKMPVGYASFVDVGKKKANCQAVGVTCSTAPNTYWPGSKVDYRVQVSAMSGPVLQNGTTMATPDGRAVANWNWRYEVNVYPDSLGSCANAGAKCVKGTVNNNNPMVSYIAQNLLPSTLYRQIVCAPVCTGGKIIQNTTARTADVPTSSPSPAVTCSQVDFDHDGSVTILDLTLMTNLNGTKAGDPKFNKAYDLNGDGVISTLDIDIASKFFGQKCDATIISDTDKDGFSDKVEAYMGTDVNLACGKNSWPPDVDNDGTVTILDMTTVANSYNTKTGDAKFNKRYDMDADGAIAVSDLNILASYFLQKCSNPVTISASARPNVNDFISKSTPTPPAITCSQVDYNRDGSVDVSDFQLLSKAYGTKVGDANYNKVYDLNYDGSISQLDMDIANTFYGQECIPTVSD